MFDSKKMSALVIIIGLIILVIFSKSHTFSHSDANIPTDENYIIRDSSDAETPPQSIYVDICGEVLNPGLIKVSSETRVFQSIEASGGLKPLADITSINLAKKLVDGEQVFVPALMDSNSTTPQTINFINTASDEETTEQGIYINISGCVNNPCVIYFNGKTNRIADAISYANGLTEGCDRSKVNLAEILYDEEYIYIQKQNASNSNNSEYSNFVNINTASLDQLSTLDGIGEVLAQRIITYRETNGNFKKTEDLIQVSGIGSKKYDAIKNNICLY